jgi:hypothetical protein
MCCSTASRASVAAPHVGAQGWRVGFPVSDATASAWFGGWLAPDCKQQAKGPPVQTRMAPAIRTTSSSAWSSGLRPPQKYGDVNASTAATRTHTTSPIPIRTRPPLDCGRQPCAPGDPLLLRQIPEWLDQRFITVCRPIVIAPRSLHEALHDYRAEGVRRWRCGPGARSRASFQAVTFVPG